MLPQTEKIRSVHTKAHNIFVYFLFISSQSHYESKKSGFSEIVKLQCKSFPISDMQHNSYIAYIRANTFAYGLCEFALLLEDETAPRTECIMHHAAQLPVELPLHYTNIYIVLKCNFCRRNWKIYSKRRPATMATFFGGAKSHRALCGCANYTI